jgi:hypothetical protein
MRFSRNDHRDRWETPAKLGGREFRLSVLSLEQATLSLYFSDAGLFGGRRVTGLWARDGLREPTLAGWTVGGQPGSTLG